jgi:hypothetical protein
VASNAFTDTGSVVMGRSLFMFLKYTLQTFFIRALRFPCLGPRNLLVVKFPPLYNSSFCFLWHHTFCNTLWNFCAKVQFFSSACLTIINL